MRKCFLILLFIFTAANTISAQSFSIKPIPNQVVAYPNALLLSFQIEGEASVADIEFSYQSGIDDAIIRGQSIYWKPEMNDAGEHQFKIVGTSPRGETASQSFTVEVKPFNAPPRFIPVRRVNIPTGFSYSLPITAIDPDGMDKNLIRYLGVNLPANATIDEKTGLFKWKPTAKQLGEHTFRVIATDQFGAASSLDVTIKVVEIPSESE
ncbi:MAG TPA: putative Ig domain-containing protein [Balneolaceae bacterium]|nr:putative Ig domain-containing protein [Balneolaceae bacterium]